MTELLLVPLELPRSSELLPWLGKRLSAMFRVDWRIDTTPFDMSPSLDRNRNQYDTRALLTALAAHQSSDWVLGVTGKDLFLPIFTFVIGEAQLAGRAAIVSTYRLSEESMGRVASHQVFCARLLKEAVHELGHCSGLVHCPNWRCVMHASSTAEDVDLKGDEPCNKCLMELRAWRRR